MKILVVGGVAGGAAFAARTRRLSEDNEIIMFEKGEHISFANCGLPYYIGDVIQDREELLVMTPEKFKDRFNVDVRIKNEVLAIDKEDKTVKVKNLETDEEYFETYDKLVLSPGASALRPPIPGIDSEKIFTLRNVTDVDQIKSFMNTNDPKKVVVVGGGFIGLEVAENLNELGIDVSLVEMLDQVMNTMDFEMAKYLHEAAKNHGINLILGNGVDRFVEEDGETIVRLQDGTALEADMIVLSIGVKPNTAFVKESGIEVNDRGAIVVNPKMETSADDIYAVGDAVIINNLITNERQMVPLAGMANKQARIVANNLAGYDEIYKGSIGTSIVKLFNLTAGSTGLNEKQLISMGKKENEDYKVVEMHGKHHVGYYPGAVTIALKMIYNPKNRRVLGAQIVGEKGVDKRIDVFSSLIKMNATIEDLKEVELAYAPPYGGAKDPVNNCGFIADNMEKGLCKNIRCRSLEECIDENSIILDVRDPDELEECGEVKSAINIPLDDLRSRLEELDKDKVIYTFCAAGLRGYLANRMLLENGFDSYNIAGGFRSINSVIGCDF